MSFRHNSIKYKKNCFWHVSLFELQIEIDEMEIPMEGIFGKIFGSG